MVARSGAEVKWTAYILESLGSMTVAALHTEV